MRLLEIFDRSVSFHVTDATAHKFRAVATITGRTLHFVMTPIDTDQWELEFAEGGSSKLTGSGGALEVFGVLKRFLEEAIARYAPSLIFFTGATRQGEFYSKLFKHPKMQFPGYRIRERKSGADRDFYLEREDSITEVLDDSDRKFLREVHRWVNEALPPKAVVALDLERGTVKLSRRDSLRAYVEYDLQRGLTLHDFDGKEQVLWDAPIYKGFSSGEVADQLVQHFELAQTPQERRAAQVKLGDPERPA